jgi:hypothetical protein
MCINYYVYIYKFICKYIRFNLYKSNLSACMIYIDRYTYIQLQYVYIYWLDNITTYGQIENNNNKKETRPFSHGWYYQPRLNGWAQVLACPPFSLGSYYEPGLKDPFRPGWFTQD